MMSDEQVVPALREYVTALSSIAPDAENSDLTARSSPFEDTDVVGLGEATHGTRDFFELKHRVVRHLVEECGFRTIAFETDFAKTRALTEAVQYGEGTPRDALDEITLWVWKTEGVLALFEWLREFNENRPMDDRVRVYGMSLSLPAEPASELRCYLQRVDPASAETVAERFRSVADTEIPTDDEAATAEYLDTGLELAATIRDRLDEHRQRYVDASSPSEYQFARHLCRHLEQNCEWNELRLENPGQFDPEAFEQRDRYMAENVEWCRKQDPGAGVVVYAHNTHVKRGSFDMDYEWAQGETMGEFLDQQIGSRYYPLGTEFARGSFRAIPNVDDADERDPRTFPVGAPHEDSVGAHLDSEGKSPLFLDIAAASDDDRLDSWFDETRRMRGVSALVDPDDETRVHDIETDVAESFDGLFFLAETEPSVPLTDE
jgi:erythromycin esterase